MIPFLLGVIAGYFIHRASAWIHDALYSRYGLIYQLRLRGLSVVVEGLGLLPEDGR